MHPPTPRGAWVWVWIEPVPLCCLVSAWARLAGGGGYPPGLSTRTHCRALRVAMGYSRTRVYSRGSTGVPLPPRMVTCGASVAPNTTKPPQPGAGRGGGLGGIWGPGQPQPTNPHQKTFLREKNGMYYRRPKLETHLRHTDQKQHVHMVLDETDRPPLPSPPTGRWEVAMLCNTSQSVFQSAHHS